MKTNRNYGMVRNAVLALAGAMVLAGFAGATDPAATFQGKFTLPFETHWGTATLPAGTYEFTLPSLRGMATIEVFRGTKAVALISSQAYDTVNAGPTAIRIVRNQGENAVRELNMPEIGISLHYASPKPKRPSAAAEREMAQQVLIHVEGK